MPSVLLTDVSIRALRPTDTYVTWYDKALPAFGVRVGKRSKTFVVMLGKERKRLTLGKYPSTKLQDARQQARDLIYGIQPPTQVRPPAISPTASEAVAIFLERHAHNARTRTISDYKRVLQKHFLPAVGALPLNEVATEQILSITDALSVTPSEANHTHAAIRTFFNWAVARRMIALSPVVGLPLPAAIGERERVLSDDELKRVYLAAQHMGYPFGFIVLICVHTGLRRSEVGSLKWSYITPDFITIPGELTKNGAQHQLPNLIGDNLQLMPKSGEYLFPSSAGTPFSAWSKNKTTLDRLAGVSDWVLHDLRRTFSTKMAEWQIAQPHVVERILNHVTGSMSPLAKIYNRHGYLPQMREALQLYEKHLAALISAH
jgi:integrase